MKRPTQPELPELADFRVETVFVDQFADAEARLKLDGFVITAMDALVGKGVYILHASRINRPGPDLDVQPRHHESRTPDIGH